MGVLYPFYEFFQKGMMLTAVGAVTAILVFIFIYKFDSDCSLAFWTWLRGTNTEDAYRDKVVLVVGASTGIGKSVAIEFARNGASVVICARTKDALDEVV